MKTISDLKNAPLGKKTQYITEYTPSLLFPITRETKRLEIEVSSPLPFHGYDIWNAYELSWLNPKGKPVVAIGQFIFPCSSPNIIESKSIKLYLNSLNNTKFSSTNAVIETIKNDFSKNAGMPVEVRIQTLSEVKPITVQAFQSFCIDELDITANTYEVDDALLTTEDKTVEETIHSKLLRSNCLATGQPDWGSLQISYAGQKINHENLLKYIISYRNHIEFHEQCVERIFMHIMQRCAPTTLTVEARYTRRGGIDINPVRSTTADIPIKLARQPRQ